jgi:hypothetical protein
MSTPKECYITSVSRSVDRVPYMIYIHKITSFLPTNIDPIKEKKGFFEYPPSAPAASMNVKALLCS